MKITFLGHAGLFVESGSVKLLCDPWLSKTGAFLASWHQFPRNDHLNPHDFAPTHVYISHKHQDHFDIPFLSTLDKDTPFILPKHLSGYVAAKLHLMGFNNLTLLGSWETEPLEGMKLTMILDPVRYIEDSSLLISTDSATIFDLNDAKLNERTSREVGAKGIDLLFSQFSGADYYPTIYQYGLDVKKVKTDLFLKSLTEQFISRTNWISPKVVIPSSGPACFLDSELFHLNFDSIFPDSFEFYERMVGKLSCPWMPMWPGESIEPPWNVRSGSVGGYIDKKAYLEEYARERLPIIRDFIDSLPEPSTLLYGLLKRRLLLIASRSPYMAQRVNCLVEFRIQGPVQFCLFADFRGGALKIGANADDEPGYIFTIDGKFLEQVLSDNISIEDFLLSLRLEIERRPDQYNWPLFALLRFGYSQTLLSIIEGISKAASDVKMVVRSGGSEFIVQRYCPHAGEDLTNAKIEDGCLTCPRHHWKFDLQTGRCVSGGNLSLWSEKIETKS